jgi:hypothetical protein
VSILFISFGLLLPNTCKILGFPIFRYSAYMIKVIPETHFSAISWREQVNFQQDDDEVRFVLDQHAELDFYSARSLTQQSAGRLTCRFTRTHYSDSEPTSLCPFSLMLRA